MNNKKFGFTLAEVLITLAIIGVVAALTLPTLISNHKKKVIAVRLEQFSAIWHQVALSAGYEQGSGGNAHDYFGTLVALNPASAEQFFKTYFSPYIHTTNIEQHANGVIAELQNGSGLYFYRTQGDYTSSSCTYLLFCPYYRDCKEIPETTMYGEYLADGKKTFTFYLDGKAPRHPHWDGTREWLVDRCNTVPGYCTTLIRYDGWKIEKDYPHSI